MQKKNILIALAVFSIVMILAQNNIDKAYALTVESNEPFTTQPSCANVGYYSPRDYVLCAGVTGGVVHIYVADGDTLTQVSDITTTFTTYNGNEQIACDNTYCYFMGQVTTNPSIIKIAMTSLTATTYTEPEYTGCSPTTFAVLAGTIYATLADLGSCPYTGIYSLVSSFTSDVASNIQWVAFDNVNVFGDTNAINACFAGTNYMVLTDSGFRVQKYVISSETLTSGSNLGSAPTDMECSTDGTTVYVSRNSGNTVNAVTVSSMATRGDSATVTGPSQLMNRGGSVYIGRSGAATITVANEDALGSNFVFYSALAHNGAQFAKGNATRFNVIAPTSNDNIPTFLWFMGAIGITLVITVFGWIDPTALIISVIIVIALAVAKVKGVFGGGGR